MSELVETKFIKKEPVEGTPDYLFWKNFHPRDEFISFEEGPHIYTINGIRGESTSVTTWVHNHFPHFDAEGVVDKIVNGQRWGNDPSYKYYQIPKEKILEMWENKKNDSCERGTKVHNDIELYFNGVSVENDSREFSFFLKFRADFPDLIPYRTEWMVYHEDLKLVGSIDMIFENKQGDLEIYDWKRCEEIKYESSFNKCAVTPCISHFPDTNFWHYSLQLNTYRKILQAKYGKKVTALYLVCVHPDNAYKSYERFEVPILDKEMDQLFEERKQQII